MVPAYLSVNADHADSREIERLTGALFSDLRRFGRLSVTRTTSPAPEGAMSAGQLAEIVLSGVFSASTVTAVAGVIKAYVQRTRGSVTWKQGDVTVVFDQNPDDVQRRLVELLEQTKGNAGE